MARRKNAAGELIVKPIPGVTPKWAEGLTHRERRFVEEYLVDLNVAQAMIRVGPEKIGGSNKGKYAHKQSAYQAGRQFQIKPEVSRAIELALNETNAGRTLIIETLVRHMNADMSQFGEMVDGEIKWKDHKDIDPDQLRCIKKMSSVPGEFGVATTYELHDAQAAAKTMMKPWGMDIVRTEISGPNGGPIEITEVDPVEAIMSETIETRNRLEASQKTGE